MWSGWYNYNICVKVLFRASNIYNRHFTLKGWFVLHVIIILNAITIPKPLESSHAIYLTLSSFGKLPVNYQNPFKATIIEHAALFI